MADEIKHEVTIAAPVSTVFNAVADFESAKQWQPALESVGLTAAKPLRTGSMVSMTKNHLAGSVFINADVTDYKPNKRIELKGMYGRFRFLREMEFTPLGGETLINDRIVVSISWLWFWYKPFWLQKLRQITAEEWQQLQQQLG